MNMYVCLFENGEFSDNMYFITLFVDQLLFTPRAEKKYLVTILRGRSWNISNSNDMVFVLQESWQDTTIV